MTFEGAKTIILTLLIAVSIYLTWNIWTTQPKYDAIDYGSYHSIEQENMEAADVIRMDGILFHTENRFFKMTDSEELARVEKDLSKWTMTSFQDISYQIADSDFSDFLMEKTNTQIMYPDPVPFGVFKSQLKVADQEIPDFSFDRIAFKSSAYGEDETLLYFVSTKNKQVIKCSVRFSDLAGFHKEMFQKASTQPEYEAYEGAGKVDLYLPKNPVVLKSRKYLIENTSINTYKLALFPEPSRVRSEAVIDGEEYTDGFRLMQVRSSSLLTFVNTIQKGKLFGDASDLLEQSILFVNNHAGWTNSYHFAGLSESEQRVTFRLYVKGIPVFNEAGLSKIEQIWGKDDIYRYTRPSFSLFYESEKEDSPIELPKAKEAIKSLTDKKNFESEQLEDLKVGYRLVKSAADSKSITLEPAWYYRYANTWSLVPFDEPGGV